MNQNLKRAVVAAAALIVPFLLVLAAGASAQRWSTPDEVAQTPVDTTVSADAEAPASTLTEVDDMAPSVEIPDANGSTIASTEQSLAVLEQCWHVFDEVLVREQRDDFVEPEYFELSEDEFERIEVPPVDFDGSIADANRRPAIGTEAADRFGEALVLTQLSNDDLLFGVDLCFEAGLLEDEPDDEFDDDEFSDDDGAIEQDEDEE